MKLFLVFTCLFILSSTANSANEEECYARIMGELLRVACKKADTSVTNLGRGARLDAEIEQVLTNYKGKIYAQYNSSLKENPNLSANFNFTITIEEGGSVSSCKYKYLSPSKKLDALANQLCSIYYKIDFLHKPGSGSTRYEHKMFLFPV